MPMDRAIEVLMNARDQAVQMVKMYADQVIPRAAEALTSAKNQLHEHRSKIIEIDAMLASVEAVADSERAPQEDPPCR